MKKLIFIIPLSISLVLLDLISFKYKCRYEDGGPDFYGFPFIYRTDTSYVNSLSGELYISGFLGNTLFWTLLLFLSIITIKQLIPHINKTILLVLKVLILIISVFIIYVSTEIIDWRYQWNHDFKINYYPDEVDCNRELLFFNKH